MSGSDTQTVPRTDLARERSPDDDAGAEELLDFDLLFAPGHLLRRNHQRSYELFSHRVGDVLTRQQAALLIALVQHPGASQNDLVAMTGMDKSTLKELLGRMAARGLVERLRDPADSRAWRLHPTSHGRRVLTEVLPHIESAQRDILAPLPPSHRALFLRMLRILAGLETLGEGARALPDVKSI